MLRPKKRKIPEVVRVDSVKIYQQGSNDELFNGIISDIEKELSMEKRTVVVNNPLTVNCEEKRILSQLYKNLSEIKNTGILDNLSVYSFEDVEIQNVWRIGKKIEKTTFEKIESLNYPFAVLCSENELKDVKIKLSNKFKITEEYIFFENEKSSKKVILLKVNKQI